MGETPSNDRRDPLASLGPGEWLSLAAAPSFALMALLNGLAGAAAMAGMPCSPAHGLLRWDGMAPMYGLMSAFHLSPWLKLAARSRAGGRRRRRGGDAAQENTA